GVSCPRALLCVMTRPPPRSPRFPYTTLFRSAGSNDGNGDPNISELEDEMASGSSDVIDARDDDPDEPKSGRAGGAVGGTPANKRDRKSTRQNSSHVKISYAVFCLKKKRHPRS